MEEDKLTDFERAEYYKTRLKSKNTFVIVFSILMFVLGFVELAKFVGYEVKELKP